MSHAFQTQTPSPRSFILSKSESSCQEQSSPSLRLSPTHAPARVPDHLAKAEGRFRFTEHARAQRAAQLCILAAELPADEQALVLARYAEGRTCPQIAALAGCTRQVIERRLRRLTARLSTPTYVYLAPRLKQLDPAQRAIARACFIEGRSIRAAAAQLNTPLHTLRETRAFLLALARAAKARPG